MRVDHNESQLPIYLSIIITVLVSAWFIGQLSLTQDPADLALTVVSSLLIIQLVCSWILSPWTSCVPHQRLKFNATKLFAVATFVVTPWPLLLICSEMSDINLTVLLVVELAIVFAPFIHSALNTMLYVDRLPRSISLTGSLLLQWVPMLLAWPYLVTIKYLLGQ